MLFSTRWANLNAFWAKEPKAVNKNFGQAKRALNFAAVSGISDPFPIMGPFPMNNKFAVIILMRSLDVGKYAPIVHFFHNAENEKHIFQCLSFFC